MLSVFADVILPVVVVALLGRLVGRWRQVTIPSLSALVFYLFSPALVFDLLSTTDLSAQLGARIFAAVALATAGLWVLATLWSTLRRHDLPLRAAFGLTVVAPNAGNMGLPVAALAFGDAGLAVAVVHMVGSSLLANASGIAACSLSEGDWRRAAKAPFAYPFLYAAAAGVAVRASGLELPTAVAAPAASLADAAIPVMLVVLGLQLRSVASRADATDLAAGGLLRLLAAPALSYGAGVVVGLEGVDLSTLVVVAAMPTAVFTTIIATEFDKRPDYVTRAVILTTAASVATLTVLITLLR